MTSDTLYAYVDGNDLDDVEEAILRRLKTFVASRDWLSPDVWLVNQRRAPDASLRPGDLPDWDLGLNLLLPDDWRYVTNWFSDVEAIVGQLSLLNDETGRDFVIGITDGGTAEDLYCVDSRRRDATQLRLLLFGEP